MAITPRQNEKTKIVMATKTKSEKSLALAMAKELEDTQREIAAFMTQAQTVPVCFLPHVVHVKSGLCGIENEIIAVLQANHATAPKTAPNGPGRKALWAVAMTATEIHAAIVKRFQQSAVGISKRYPRKTIIQYLSHTMRPAGYVASIAAKTPDEKASIDHTTNIPCKWFLVNNSKQAKQGHK